MYIGIDLGGTNIVAGLVDEKGCILHKDKIKTGADRHYMEIVRDMAELSKKVISDAGYSIQEIEWVGIGSPGSCDNDAGELIYANNLKFEHTPLREEFQKHLNVPVYLANDADCAAYGEVLAGNAKGSRNSVTITLGTGVGGGTIIDGKILNGFNSCAGELGHMVIKMDGEECTCGRRGCWEQYASATGLIRQTKKAMEEHPESLLWQEVSELEEVSGKTAFDAAKKGDQVAKNVVDTYLRYVAEGISNIVSIFQPENILIGGGISHEGEYILEPIRQYVRDNDYNKTDKQTKIMTAALGNDAGIIGAAFLGAHYAGIKRGE